MAGTAGVDGDGGPVTGTAGADGDGRRWLWITHVITHNRRFSWQWPMPGFYRDFMVSILSKEAMERRLSILIHMREAAPLLSSHEAFSHETALEFYGVDASPYVSKSYVSKNYVPQKEDKRTCGVGGEGHTSLHVCAPTRSKRGHRNGMIAHLWTAEPEITMIGEVRVVSAPVCWAQIAQHCDLHGLILIGALLVCRDPSRRACSLKDLRDYVDQNPGFHGRKKCVKALGLIPENTDSPPEVEVYLLLRKHGIPTPICNLALQDKHGVLYVDLAYPDLKLGIEYEGGYHAKDERQMRRDRERYNRLHQLGWSILFVTKDHMKTELTKLELIRTVTQMREKLKNESAKPLCPMGK